MKRLNKFEKSKLETMIFSKITAGKQITAITNSSSGLSISDWKRDGLLFDSMGFDGFKMTVWGPGFNL
jgi:hypothetical protein